MARYKALVLEDEEDWLNRHRIALEADGIECVCTRNGKSAIALVLQDRSIMVGVIDEILLSGPDELQKDQGSDVVQKIHQERPEVKFVMISAKPFIESGGESRTLLREERKLRQIVHAFYHKWDLRDAPKEEYSHLAMTVKSLHPGMHYEGRVLVGFGLEQVTFEGIRENFGSGKSWWMDVSRWDETDESKRYIVECLFASPPRTQLPVRENLIFYVGPGDRRPFRVPEFAPSEIRFLKVFAQKAAFGEEALITPGDYFNGSKRALKTAKRRVESRLVQEHPSLRFKPWNGGTYKAEFEVGTALFNIESPAATATRSKR